jgi:uncharacterized membrane protein
MRLRIPLLYLLLAIVLAGLIHLAAVLALPSVAPKNAFARLKPLGDANVMIELPPVKPGEETMPMQVPDVRYAFCRYDLSGGPVRLSAVIPDDLWLIAFYTPKGDNFYAVSGADMRRGKVDMIINETGQPVPEADADAPEEEEVVVVESPLKEGIAMIRAPLSGASRSARTAEALKSATCAPFAR